MACSSRLMRLCSYVLPVVLVTLGCVYTVLSPSTECQHTLLGRMVRMFGPYVYGLSCVGDQEDGSSDIFSYLVRKVSLFLSPPTDMNMYCVLNWHVMSFNFRVKTHECVHSNTSGDWGALPQISVLVSLAWLALRSLSSSGEGSVTDTPAEDSDQSTEESWGEAEEGESVTDNTSEHETKQVQQQEKTTSEVEEVKVGAPESTTDHKDEGALKDTVISQTPDESNISASVIHQMRQLSGENMEKDSAKEKERQRRIKEMKQMAEQLSALYGQGNKSSSGKSPSKPMVSKYSAKLPKHISAKGKQVKPPKFSPEKIRSFRAVTKKLKLLLTGTKSANNKKHMPTSKKIYLKKRGKVCLMPQIKEQTENEECDVMAKECSLFGRVDSVLKRPTTSSHLEPQDSLDREVAQIMAKQIEEVAQPATSKMPSPKRKVPDVQPLRKDGRLYISEVRDYRVLGILADGSFSTVYIAKSQGMEAAASSSDNEEGPDYVAIKFANKITIKRCQFKANYIKMAKNECKILTNLTCPFLLKSLEHFQTFDHLVYVLPLMCGSLVECDFNLTERQMLLLAAEITSALVYLNEMGYIHRDVKPDNVLVAYDGHLKLADFGCSQDHVYGQRRKYGGVGTLSFAAPEVHTGYPYNESCDYWSLGVIMYLYREDRYPTHNGEQGMVTEVHDIPFRWASPAERQFIRSVLRMIPDQRPGGPYCPGGDIRNHSYFNGLNFERLKNKEYEGPCFGMGDPAESYALQGEQSQPFDGVPVSAIKEVSAEDLSTFDEFPALKVH